MMDDHHTDFFLILGYLASPERRTKLDIETHPKRQRRLEREYFGLTGVRLVPDDVNYYVWSPNVNKWGSELRIYFRKNNNIPPSLEAMAVAPRFSSNYHNARINNNDFVWKLIEYGFRAKDTQNVNLIRSKIPQNRMGEFDTGLNLP
jgi:hypothetical protein